MSIASWPVKIAVFGRWPMAMKTPSAASSLDAPVRRLRRRDAGDGLGRAGGEDLLDRAIPDHADLGMGEEAGLEDLLGAERVAAMDQRDLGGVVGEVERLLDGGVAAAHDDDALAAEEEAVAGGAGRDAGAAQALLGGKAEPARLGAGGDDDGVRDIAVARSRPGRRRAIARNRPR